jgi:hypothetical protein
MPAVLQLRSVPGGSVSCAAAAVLCTTNPNADMQPDACNRMPAVLQVRSMPGGSISISKLSMIDVFKC